MDRLSPMQRSQNMARIKSRDTRPEMVVRMLVHRLGVRFRTCDKALPGKPDLVFRSKKRAIFVHGCFWHAHTCRDGKMPATNMVYWRAKRRTNRMRDRKIQELLEREGWSVLIVWECECSGASRERLERTLTRFLGSRKGSVPRRL